MGFLDFMPLLADVGHRYFVGFIIGLAAGIASGLAAGRANGQRIAGQLNQAIMDGEIVVQNKAGDRLTGDELLAQLAQRHGGD